MARHARHSAPARAMPAGHSSSPLHAPKFRATPRRPKSLRTDEQAVVATGLDTRWRHRQQQAGTAGSARVQRAPEAEGELSFLECWARATRQHPLPEPPLSQRFAGNPEQAIMEWRIPRGVQRASACGYACHSRLGRRPASQKPPLAMLVSLVALFVGCRRHWGTGATTSQAPKRQRQTGAVASALRGVTRLVPRPGPRVAGPCHAP
mmetsp:Transcript_27527/g.87475  ORF Transcript_27527/g.87475 Transcript_27527/m.87475 type:complete len:207 (-) Transcript_27527:280-900(-)